MRFEQATAVTSAGSGAYDVELREEYAIAGTKPNGGYMLACIARAVVAAAGQEGSPHVHPIAAGAQYLTSPNLGPARIEVDVQRVGRTATQVAARLSQDGSTAVTAQFTLATLPAGSRPYWGGVPPVELPPIEDCQGLDPGQRRNDTWLVFDPATSFTMTPDGPVSSGGGELRAWFQTGDGTVDPVMLLFVADAMPPATFGVVSTGWVPTLDITAYVRAVPAPGPLRVRFRAQMIQDGFADEVLEAWDAEGRLVLQSTQAVALRHPVSGPA